MTSILKQYAALGTVWFWLFIAASLAVYAITVTQRKNNTAVSILYALNTLLQIGMIVYLLFVKASPEELFFALLILTAGAFISLRLRSGKASSENETQNNSSNEGKLKEDKEDTENGI